MSHTSYEKHFDHGPPKDTEFPNRWPDERELHGFRNFMEQFFEEFETFGFHLLQVLEIALQIPLDS
jgi:isopenicillin N synthase-like dioxygenase